MHDETDKLHNETHCPKLACQQIQRQNILELDRDSKTCELDIISILMIKNSESLLTEIILTLYFMTSVYYCVVTLLVHKVQNTAVLSPRVARTEIITQSHSPLPLSKHISLLHYNLFSHNTMSDCKSNLLILAVHASTKSDE